MPGSNTNLSRRELLAGAGAGAAALLLDRAACRPRRRRVPTVVFTHTTVANADAVQNDVALAVEGDRIAAIGPTDQLLTTYPRAEVYDGRGKAIFPGLDQLPRAHGARSSSAGSTKTSASPTPRASPFSPPASCRAKRRR